ncbi:MAG: RNA polymerase sigma-70 factor [Bacteroidales bacterium]|jgi:RNA polymerase sigma-70 factor (ECF subfamily)
MTRDQEIISRIRKGDKKEFESLFRSYYVLLVRYAKSIIRDHDTAEEIVQNLFVRVWQKRGTLLIETSLNGYLYKAVHNQCLHYIDHQKIVEKHAQEMGRRAVAEAENPLDAIQYKELQERMTSILERLPERCSMIFCMNRFEGLRYAEIAEKLSVSLKTVEANMGRALKEFRKALIMR